MTGAAGSPLWTVDDQVEGFARVGDGPVVPVMTIKFTTRSGVKSSLDIPRQDYFEQGPDHVTALITERASSIEAVHGAQGAP